DALRRRHAIEGIESGGRGSLHPSLRHRGARRGKRGPADRGIRLGNRERPRNHPGEVPRARGNHRGAGASRPLQALISGAMKPVLRSGDFWSGLALAALGAHLLSEAHAWTYMGEEGPGAGFFPMWYGGALVLLSFVLVAQAAWKGSKPAPAQPPQWRELGRALGCWLAFVASIALMPWLGFAVSFMLLTWFIVAVMSGQSQRRAWGLAI